MVSVQSVVDTILTHKGVIGIATGGSSALEDKHSDIDLFVVVENGKLVSDARQISASVTSKFNYSIWSDLKFIDGFGLKSSWLGQDMLGLEIFFNTPSSLMPNSMRLKLKPLFDPDGVLSNCVKEAESWVASDKLLDSACYDLLVEFNKISKYLYRNKFAAARYRLCMVYRIVTALELHADGKMPYAPLDAYKDSTEERFIKFLLEDLIHAAETQRTNAIEYIHRINKQYSSDHLLALKSIEFVQ
jgi:hypothetical protein